MTDTNISEELKALSTSVTEHRIEIAGKIGKLTTKVEGLTKSSDGLINRIDKIALNQASCTARTGQTGVNARLKRIEKKSSEDRIHVETELKALREEQTGQIDIINTPKIKPNGSMLLASIKYFGPFLAALLFALGVYFGTGGDDEKTVQILQNVREIGLRVEKIEESKTLPVHIPVPVTFSEDIP